MPVRLQAQQQAGPAAASIVRAPLRMTVEPAPRAAEPAPETAAASAGSQFDFSSLPIDPPPAIAGDAAAHVQRKCACTGPDAQCAECQGDQVLRSADGAASDGPPSIPSTLLVSAPGDRLELEADRMAERALRSVHEPATASPRATPHIQRAAAAPAGYVVDDDTATLTTGQMRKTELLALLRAGACAAADRELARVGRDTQGCPYIERWLDYYAGRSAAQLEAAIRRFAPGATSAASARDYVPVVSARVAAGVATWVATGEIPGDVPPELRDAVTGGGVAGAIGSVMSAIGGALSAIGSLFFRGASGGARAGVDRDALAARLGSGRPLDRDARARMEAGFSRSFADVQVHDDATAAGLARDLNAHAFTLGAHVAFAGGRYQPNARAADLLLAHELAHVVQQGAAPALQAKLRGPPAAGSGDPRTVQAELGAGAHLDGGVRGRMERAFGHSFGDVRVHTDGTAARLTDQHGARAFTVGTDVAFGAGEYRPGTLGGDLLIAHELAHTVQQTGGGTSSASDDRLEQAADRAALRALDLAPGDREQLGSGGLRLQRCKKTAATPIAYGSTAALIANVKACDGGLGLWAAARRANGDRDPSVAAESTGAGFTGDTDPSTGKIRIAPTLSLCDASQVLVQELSNLSRKGDFATLESEAAAGNVSRDDYIRRNERIEYETGVRNCLTAFDACKTQWGCPATATAEKEWARNARDFDDYFNSYLGSSHKDYYGNFWDTTYKAAYQAKHP